MEMKIEKGQQIEIENGWITFLAPTEKKEKPMESLSQLLARIYLQDLELSTQKTG
ncbi:hypothetical protein [Pseudoneobacillus sp. C159]